MIKGKVSGIFGNTGQIISEGNTYKFNINVVNGTVVNGDEVEFEHDGKQVNAIYGTNAIKPSVPEPVKAEPVPEPIKTEPKKRQNISKRLLDNDDRDFLTEEK